MVLYLYPLNPNPTGVLHLNVELSSKWLVVPLNYYIIILLFQNI